MSHPAADRLVRLAVCLAAVALHACGDDLGQCDQQAALQLVYGRGGLVATKGQALMHDSCGNAAFCHSTGAEHDKRFGAPAGLNFDMMPPTGWSEVVEHRDDIWSATDDGSMPPGARGKKAIGDGDWVFDGQRRKDADKLPALSTREGKAAFRNWLACGAPVVGTTHVPTWAQAPTSSDEDGGVEGGGDGATWTRVHTEVIATSCALAGCHNPAGASGAGMLDMSNLCKARDALFEKGPCGEPRVRPGDADSLLVDKIESAKPRCMSRMPPPLGGLPASSIELVRAWVVAGANAPECP